MNIIKKIKSMFDDNICDKCGGVNDETYKQLYMLPQTVGHYVSHKDPSYYKKNLIKVNKKADIPVGTYACGMIEFTCRECNRKCVRLVIFLPVRNQEKNEEVLYFFNGEFDDFMDK